MKRQNPKELTKRTFSFHYRLSSLVTLLTPAFCFLGFFAKSVTIPLCSTSGWGSWDAQRPGRFSAAGTRCRWMCWFLVCHGAPWEVTATPGAGTVPSSTEHTSLAWLSNKPRHHVQLHWLFRSVLVAPNLPEVTQLTWCNPSLVSTDSKGFLLEGCGKQRNMYMTWGQA